jgi:putative transposase
VWNIDSTKDETIERKIHINPRDCARRKCANSNQRAMRNAFFLLIAPIAGHFQPRRHRMSAQDYRATLQNRSQVWNEVTGVKQAA